MQIRVDKLREVFKLVQPVVPRKTVLPVLKNVLLRDGQAIATDAEVMVALKLPEAEGEYLIPHQAVLELLKYVPGDELLSIEQPNGKLELSWEGGKASYDTTDPKEFPPAPEVKDGASGVVDGDRLMAALLSVVEYCSTEDNRPVLTGICLSLGKTIEVAAGNGFVMAYQILPISFPSEEKLIIPSHSARVLAGLWNKVPPAVPLEDSLISQVICKRKIEISLGKGLMVRFGRVTLFSQLIEGSAPNFKQLIPKEQPLKVRLFAPELECAVRRCADIAKDGKGIIRLSWTETTMTVSAKSEAKGNVEAEIKVQTEGGEGKVAINVNYLLNYLKGKEGLLTIGATDPQSPLLFRHSASPQVVMMPMFVEWGKTEAKEEGPEESPEESEEVLEESPVE